MYVRRSVFFVARVWVLLLGLTSAAAFASGQSDAPIPPEYAYAEGDSLRAYAEHAGLLFGTVGTNRDLFGPSGDELRRLAAREFNFLWVDALWRDIEPADGVFDYSKVDELVSFGIQNGMTLKCFAGPWYLLNPEWLEKKGFAELGPILKRHIEAGMGAWKGKIKLWDVFDEVVNDAGNGVRNRQPNPEPRMIGRMIWIDGSDVSLIADGFRTARKADPDALLFLNEFGNEDYWGNSLSFNREKGKYFFDFVMRLKKEGVPIDGVGFQLHQSYPAAGGYPDIGPGRLEAYLKRIDETVKRYAAQGLLVEFSEVDVSIKLDDLDMDTDIGKAAFQRRLEHQALIYEGLMRVALDNRNVVAFITFMFTDKYPNVSPQGYGKPHIFDEELKPKPAYYRLLYALKERAAKEGPQPSRLR
jgi:endo-1,4-beta-xylanase